MIYEQRVRSGSHNHVRQKMSAQREPRGELFWGPVSVCLPLAALLAAFRVVAGASRGVGGDMAGPAFFLYAAGCRRHRDLWSRRCASCSREKREMGCDSSSGLIAQPRGCCPWLFLRLYPSAMRRRASQLSIQRLGCSVMKASEDCRTTALNRTGTHLLTHARASR